MNTRIKTLVIGIAAAIAAMIPASTAHASYGWADQGDTVAYEIWSTQPLVTISMTNSTGGTSDYGERRLNPKQYRGATHYYAYIYFRAQSTMLPMIIVRGQNPSALSCATYINNQRTERQASNGQMPMVLC